MNTFKHPYIKVSGQYENLLYVESLYSLALYLYLFPTQEKTIFILVESIATGKLLEQLDNVIVISKQTKINDSDRMLLKFGIIPKKIKFLHKHLTKNVRVFGHDHLRLSSFIFKWGGSVIEDGLANYKAKQAIFTHSAMSRVIKSILNPCKCYPFGWNSKVDEIYLTGLKEIPSELDHKVNKVDRKEFIDSLPHILNGYFVAEQDSSNRDKKVLILTQTFYTNGYLSHDEQINLYTNIVNMFVGKGLLVSLKPHPRDKCDYSSIVNANIVSPHVLAESFYNSFSKIVSISSSANPPKLSTDSLEFIHLGGAGLTKLSEAAQNTTCSNPEYKMSFFTSKKS